jgi:hypothetical protein
MLHSIFHRQTWGDIFLKTPRLKIFKKIGKFEMVFTLPTNSFLPRVLFCWVASAQALSGGFEDAEQFSRWLIVISR